MCVVLLPGAAHMSNTLRFLSFTSRACPVTIDGKFCSIPYSLGSVNEGTPVMGSVISTAIPLKRNIITLYKIHQKQEINLKPYVGFISPLNSCQRFILAMPLPTNIFIGSS